MHTCNIVTINIACDALLNKISCLYLQKQRSRNSKRGSSDHFVLRDDSHDIAQRGVPEPIEHSSGYAPDDFILVNLSQLLGRGKRPRRAKF